MWMCKFDHPSPRIVLTLGESRRVSTDNYLEMPSRLPSARIRSLDTQSQWLVEVSTRLELRTTILSEVLFFASASNSHSRLVSHQIIVSGDCHQANTQEKNILRYIIRTTQTSAINRDGEREKTIRLILSSSRKLMYIDHHCFHCQLSSLQDSVTKFLKTVESVRCVQRWVWRTIVLGWSPSSAIASLHDCLCRG